MKTFIFGYGSLIYPEGINSRGLSRVYIESDLKDAFLSSFKRSWEVMFEDTLYLGVTLADRQGTNGVIFEVSKDDMLPLIESENANGADRSYDVIEVTTLISSWYPLPNDAKVFTFVSHDPIVSMDYLAAMDAVSLHYIDSIVFGLDERGETFKKDFLKTTYPTFLIDQLTLEEE